MKKRAINWWNIIIQISRDKSKWDYLEPAEIMEIVQIVKEAKEKIVGLERYIHIDLGPAVQKSRFLMSYMHIGDIYGNLNMLKN